LSLDRRSVVEWWENRSSPEPADLVRAGHRVMNAGWWPTYFVTGGPLASLRAPVQEMYEGWEAYRFEGPYTRRWLGGPPDIFSLHPDEPLQLGAKINVWNDDPAAMTEDEIADGIGPRLRVLAQKTWASPSLTDRYAVFKQR
jgi:hexosaminidase